MKNLSIIALLFTLATCSLAQETNSFKPGADDYNLEFQFTPFGSSPIGISGIRVRKFQSENIAYRLNLFLSYSSDKIITQQGDSLQPELKNTNNVFQIRLRPGIEKHLPGTDRLSPYFGVELDLGFQKTTNKQERELFTPDPEPGEVVVDKILNQNGFLRLGLNAIAGFDFYVAERLYLGAELGYGFFWQKGLDIKYKTSEDGVVPPDPEVQGGEFSISPSVVSAIRMGYIFNK